MEAVVGTQPRPAGRLRTAAWWTLGAAAALAYGVLFAYSPLIGIGVLVVLLASWYAARRLEMVALGLFLVVPMGRLTWLDTTGTLDITKFLVAGLGLAWGVRCLVKRDRTLVSVWTESAVSVCIILFMLANALSLLGTHLVSRSIVSMIRFTALFVMYGLVLAMVRTRRDTKIVAVLLLVSGLVVCLIGCWEAATHQYLWARLGQERSTVAPLTLSAGSAVMETGSVSDTSMMRIISVFTDYNYMGGYMAVLLGIACGCFLAWRKWYVRLPLLGMIGIVLYCLVRTGSRGGLMGVAATATVLLLFSRIRIRWFIFAVIVIGAIMVFPIVNEYVPEFRHGISIDALKEDQRYGYWQMALHMIRDYPLLGVGTDNYFVMYPFYRISPALMYSFYCHNIYLQMWAEAGIPGLLSILALITTVVLSYATALREARDDEGWRSIVLGFFAALVGYAVFAATCNTLHDQPLWLLYALAVVTLRATRQEAPAAPA